MKNLSCFKCKYHKCINHNICTKKKCKLKEGYYYNTSNRIVKEYDKNNNINLNLVENNNVNDEYSMSFKDSLVFLN